MRKLLLITLFSFYASAVFCQVLTAKDFVILASLSEKKVTGYLARSGFKKSDQQQQFDTVQQTFQLNHKKTLELLELKDSAVRFVQRLLFEGKSAINYCTSSFDECQSIISGLKENGFHCENENSQAPFLYQRGDVTVKLI